MIQTTRLLSPPYVITRICNDAIDKARSHMSSHIIIRMRAITLVLALATTNTKDDYLTGWSVWDSRPNFLHFSKVCEDALKKRPFQKMTTAASRSILLFRSAISNSTVILGFLHVWASLNEISFWAFRKPHWAWGTTTVNDHMPLLHVRCSNMLDSSNRSKVFKPCISNEPQQALRNLRRC